MKSIIYLLGTALILLILTSRVFCQTLSDVYRGHSTNDFYYVNTSLFHLYYITDDGKDIAAEYFHVVNNQLVLAKPAIFCMSSMDERTIRQDCLGYLMERIKRESLLNIEI